MNQVIDVRHPKTGERHQVVVRDGHQVVIDMLGQKRPVPYKPHEWLIDTVPKRMSLMQAAEIAFAADQRIQAFFGEHARASKPWISLREEDRIEFAEKGPKAPPVRRLLWKVIMGALKTQMEET